jgi:hypothetical protein
MSRTPAEALAYADGYGAGLDQARKEAAALIRARFARLRKAGGAEYVPPTAYAFAFWIGFTADQIEQGYGDEPESWLTRSDDL